jgi:hypothetical protein
MTRRMKRLYHANVSGRIPGVVRTTAKRIKAKLQITTKNDTPSDKIRRKFASSLSTNFTVRRLPIKLWPPRSRSLRKDIQAVKDNHRP